MGMQDAGTGLKTRLATITSLNQVFSPSEIPDSINAFPCAIILPGKSDYDPTLSEAANVDVTFRILILLGKPDQPSALNTIIEYADPTGTNSVRAAIHADMTLGGNADTCQVISNSGAGYTVWGGIIYLSTEFEIKVYV